MTLSCNFLGSNIILCIPLVVGSLLGPNSPSQELVLYKDICVVRGGVHSAFLLMICVHFLSEQVSRLRDKFYNWMMMWITFMDWTGFHLSNLGKCVALSLSMAC